MTEAEWVASADPTPMLHFLWEGASDRKFRLFTIACCRCSRQLLLNRNHRDALKLSARFVDGQATEDELTIAYERANNLACSLYTGESEREIHRWAEATAVANAVGIVTADYRMAGFASDAVWMIHRASRRNPDQRLATLLRDIVGNPFRPIAFDPRWRTGDAVGLALSIYGDGAFDRLPLLADALMDAGCADEQVLLHCRSDGPHVRGCWVVDLVLGKE